MLKKISFFILFVFSILSLVAQNEPLSPRTASYDIQVTLDTENKYLHANEVLHWTNPSLVDTVRELQFHVYLNAFKNNQSTYLSGGGSFGEMTKEEIDNCTWGWLDIEKMVDEHGNDLTPNMEYIQLDDGNEADQTVLRVPLPQPVLPGEKIDVQMNWVAKIPKTISRTGYSKDFFFQVQWFPKVGVYEPAGMRFSKKGNWNCHQYHSRTEYYSDFGLYNVDITVPKNYTVGASGYLVKIEEKGDTKTHSYRAEDVIDFAWSAAPDFVEMKKKWRDVDIRLLTHEEHECFAPRIFSAATNALDYLDDFVGEYPYPTLTIVAPPFYGLRSGAMEYPTLITTFVLRGLPDGMHGTETLTVHELVHQYFMQMIATNEQEEAWLDEGFTSYFEAKIMDKYFEGYFCNDYFDVNVGSQELRRGRFFGGDNIKLAPLSAPSYKVENGSHREITYGKTATWLWTLEGMLGEETMKDIMQTYFQEWKFKHPCGEDFIDVVNKVVRKNHGTEFGENMDWFFDQVVYGTQVCDYSIAGVYNRRLPQPMGYLSDEECSPPLSTEEYKHYESKIIVYRNGEMQLPVEILITFADGTTELKKWDGKDRSFAIKYKDHKQIISAEIDPERKIYIDKNFINNSITHRSEGRGIRKTVQAFLFWMQNALLSVGILV